jgi:hypothetical protein
MVRHYPKERESQRRMTVQGKRENIPRRIIKLFLEKEHDRGGTVGLKLAEPGPRRLVGLAPCQVVTVLAMHWYADQDKRVK